MCKANRKLSVLLRLSKFLCLDKRRTHFKSFIEAQFKYCPLIWMFCSGISNKNINRLHERALRLVYDDYSSRFETLLERDSSFTIHHKNIQSMLIEIYKSLNKASAENFSIPCLNLNLGSLSFLSNLKYPFATRFIMAKILLDTLGPEFGILFLSK